MESKSPAESDHQLVSALRAEIETLKAELHAKSKTTHVFPTLFDLPPYPSKRADRVDPSSTTATVMRAVTFDFEQKKFLYRTDAPIPEPGPGEARVRVVAASANPIDSLHHLWSELVDQDNPQRASFVVGVDFAGVIEKLGSTTVASTEGGSCQFQVGDRVVCHPLIAKGCGAYAEYAIGQLPYLIKIPSSISFESAAATPCACWTAYKSLSTMGISQGKSILISGGAGGLGGFAIQLARNIGCHPIITTCSPSNNERVLQLGATHCVNYRSATLLDDLKKVIRQANKEKGGQKGASSAVVVDFIHDGVSSSSAKQLAELLAFDGHIACCSGILPRSEGEPYFRSWTIHDIATAPPAYFGGHDAHYRFMGREVMKLLVAGNIDPMITKAWRLSEEFAQALTTRTATKTGGKSIVSLHVK